MITLREFFIRYKQGYLPRTPNAALRGVRKRMILPEYYTYLASSIKPLYEEPFELDEIERIMAIPKKDIYTIMLLVKILTKLLSHDDPEIVLFAAESLNKIETSYNEQIHTLKESKSRNRKTIMEIIHLYIFLAKVNDSRANIKRFYLKEAFDTYNGNSHIMDFEDSDLLVIAEVLIELGLTGQAQKIVDKIQSQNRQSALISAQIAFKARNFTAILGILQKQDRDDQRCELSERDYYSLMSYWQGQEHE